MTTPNHLRTAVLTAAALVGAGCAPRARPLTGSVVPRAVLPPATLPPVHQRVVFRWRYVEEEGFSARGEGAARLAPPDSGRLDFFLDGGLGGGYAVLVGGQLSAPGGDMVRRVVPPAPLLWAAFGRMAIPASADTVIRSSGDTLRADVGRDPTWRVTFTGPRLARLERIESGRIVEWIARDSSTIRYRHEAGRRSLTLDVLRTETVNAFPSAIWTR